MIDLNEVRPIGAVSGPRVSSFGEITTRLNERIEDVARALCGEPNRALSTRAQLRYGNHGSLAIEIAGDKRGEWYDHENKVGGGAIDLVRRHTGLSNGEAAEWLVSELGIPIEAKRQPQPRRRIVATYDYCDEAGELLFQVVRYEPKDLRHAVQTAREAGPGGSRASARCPIGCSSCGRTRSMIPFRRRRREGRRSAGEPRLRRHLQRRWRQQVAGRAQPLLPGPDGLHPLR